MAMALAAVLMLLPAACSPADFFASALHLPTVGNVVTLDTVFKLENSYGAAQSLAVAYVGIERCTPDAPLSATHYCSDQTIVNQLHSADVNARSMLAQAETFARAHDGESTLQWGDILSAAQTAISDFQKIVPTRGASS
jgi:hypothetical protein